MEKQSEILPLPSNDEKPSSSSNTTGQSAKAKLIHILIDISYQHCKHTCPAHNIKKKRTKDMHASGTVVVVVVVSPHPLDEAQPSQNDTNTFSVIRVNPRRFQHAPIQILLQPLHEQVHQVHSSFGHNKYKELCIQNGCFDFLTGPVIPETANSDAVDADN